MCVLIGTWCSFSQDNAATRVRFDAVFNNDFIMNFMLSIMMKNVENWTQFGEVTGKSLTRDLFDSQWPVFCVTMYVIVYGSRITQNFVRDWLLCM